QMGATVVMVCRNRERGQAARDDIKRRSGNDSISVLIADLTSQASIRRLVAQFEERFPRLDVLINNAAVITHERILTGDGIETQWAVNHLAPFLLTNLLIDMLGNGRSARVINVSSHAHRIVNLDFSDLQSGHAYHPRAVYAQTKLATVLFTYELARQLSGTGITANCLDPGVTATKMLADYAGVPKILGFIPKLLGASPDKGARTILYLASSPEVEGITGQYFVNRHAVSSSPASYDVVAAKRLWEISQRLTHLLVNHRDSDRW
ncbi:SDR family oxidoreductase, partial [Candidatus Poribacteria bacterium]|nr:SDR family oxidoreductase [Candidatus Poribacteria bacterium]